MLTWSKSIPKSNVREHEMKTESHLFLVGRIIDFFFIFLNKIKKRHVVG